MFIGAARIRLHLPENQSLKGKRQVVKPIVSRVQNRFNNIAVAEIADQDLWQIAEIGLCCVSDEAAHASEMLNKVILFIEESRIDAEVTDVETEIINVF